MTSWAKLLLLILDGLATLAHTMKREAHDENKAKQNADPVTSFNDKFGGLPKSDERGSPVCDHEACSQCSGKCERESRD